MDLVKIGKEVEDLARSVGWKVSETRMASTGSIYIDLVRKDEWCVIRVANHKQVYFKWMECYSIAPGDLWFEDLEDILNKPYGEVGDIL
jgi:hypothetical protein